MFDLYIWWGLYLDWLYCLAVLYTVCNVPTTPSHNHTMESWLLLTTVLSSIITCYYHNCQQKWEESVLFLLWQFWLFFFWTFLLYYDFFWENLCEFLEKETAKLLYPRFNLVISALPFQCKKMGGARMVWELRAGKDSWSWNGFV